MSSMRIVLVDPLGDVLFSGESLLGRQPGRPIANSDVDETESQADADGGTDCPETLRSGESGIFPAPRAKGQGPNAATTSSTDATSDQKRDERAA